MTDLLHPPGKDHISHPNGKALKGGYGTVPREGMPIFLFFEDVLMNNCCTIFLTKIGI